MNKFNACLVTLILCLIFSAVTFAQKIAVIPPKEENVVTVTLYYPDGKTEVLKLSQSNTETEYHNVSNGCFVYGKNKQRNIFCGTFKMTWPMD